MNDTNQTFPCDICGAPDAPPAGPISPEGELIWTVNLCAPGEGCGGRIGFADAEGDEDCEPF